MRALSLLVVVSAWWMVCSTEEVEELLTPMMRELRRKNRKARNRNAPPAPVNVNSTPKCSNNVNNNHPICYDILESQWWKDRKEFSNEILINAEALDTICSRWTTSYEECVSPGKRQGQMNDDEKKAPCVMIGAHDKTCVGNPCNQLNNGDCQLYGYKGYCVWFELADLKKINDFRGTLSPQELEFTSGLMPSKPRGCYRNPCNIAGTGKQNQDTCGIRGVPNLFECTYCKGSGDQCGLEGQGMGCQMTQLEWKYTNKCAPVNDPAVDKSSIVMVSSKKRCQCSTDLPKCKKVYDDDQDQKSPVYKPRY